MPVCCSNAGISLAAAPELMNEVVTATFSVDSPAGATWGKSVAAAAQASTSLRAAWTRVTTVGRIGRVVAGRLAESGLPPSCMRFCSAGACHPVGTQERRLAGDRHRMVRETA